MKTLQAAAQVFGLLMLIDLFCLFITGHAHLGASRPDIFYMP